MLISTFCVLILMRSCFANPISDDVDILKYFKDIQSSIDNSVKPCENFGKFACGKLKTVVSTTLDQMNHLIEQQLNNNQSPLTKDGNLIREFHLSCKNGGDITKLFDQVELISVTEWPVTRDYTDNEIAELFAYLATIDISGLLSIYLQGLAYENIITINLDSKFEVDEKKEVNILTKLGVTQEQTLKTVEDISSLIQQFQAIKTEEKIYNFNNVAALKEAVPNFEWDTYFTIFTRAFDLDQHDFVNKPVQINDLSKLKKVIDIIKATDSKIVANYIIGKLIAQMNDTDCHKLMSMLYPYVAIQNIKDDNDHKSIILRESETFNHFEKSLKALKSNLNYPESNNIKRYQKIRKYGYENYDKFLSGKYLSILLNNIEFKEDTLYKNIIKFIHALYKDLLGDDEKPKLLAFMDFLMYHTTKYILVDDRNKSSLYRFVTDNSEFWLQTYMVAPHANWTASDSCLPYENKYDNFKNILYLKTHAAHHAAINDYLNFIDKHKDEFKKETEFNELNHDKAVMLILAQARCEDYGTQSLDDNDDNLLWFFKHSKHFSDTWGCVVGDAMYKVCDDSTFVINFKKSS